ncbi:MAG: beta strand repeat-containing protein, partial [Chthoniobacter sp.]
SLFLQNENNLPVSVSVGGNNQNASIPGALTGTGTLIKNGTGTLILTATNSTAAITLNAGTLDVSSNSNALGTGVFTINGGTLAFGNQNNASAGGLAGSGTLTLLNNFASPVTFAIGGNNSSTIFSGSLAGSGTLSKTGSGTLTLSGDNSAFGGIFSIDGGFVQLANVNAAAGGTVVLGSGTLTFGQLTAVTLGGLAGNAPLSLQNDAGLPVAVSVGANNQNTTMGGALTGAGTLIKTGTGTLILTSSSSTAAITLNSGTLAISSTLGSGVFTINGGTLSFGNLPSTSAGGLAGSGTVTLFNNSSQPVTLTVGSNNFSTVFSGSLAGPGILSKIGTGRLTLSGDSSSFSGSLSVDGGTVQLANVNAAAGGTVVLGSGTLAFSQLTAVTLGGLAGNAPLSLQNDAGLPVAVSVGANNQNTTMGGALTGAGTLIKIGTGTLILTSSSSTAAITLNSGTLAIGSNSNALGSGNFTINGGTVNFGNQFSANAGGLGGSGTLTLLNSSSQPVTFSIGGNNLSTVFSGSIVGPGSLSKSGTGTLTLSGDNSGSAFGLSIGSGTVRLANVNAAAGASVIFNGGALSFGTLTAATLGQLGGSVPLALQNDALSAVAVSIGANNGDSSYFGNISGPGSLIKVGTGILTISGNNTYIGGTYLNGGSLTPFSTTLGTGPITFGGGTLRYTTNTTDFSAAFNSTPNQPFNIAVTSNPVTFGTALTSAGGSLTKLGTGSLNMGAVNIYSGPTTVAEGTLAVFAINGIPVQSAVTVNAGATFAMNATSDAIGSLAGAGNVTLGTNSVLNSGNDNTSTTFSGSISGSSGAVTKSGTGKFILSGSNNYGGPTNVARGSLIVSGSLNGTTNVTVGDGINPATLGGSGRIGLANGGALTVKPGATLAPDKSTQGLLVGSSGAGTVAFQSGSTFQLSMANNQSGAPSLNDYSKLTIGTGVSATLGGNIVTSFDGPLYNGDLFTIILRSGGTYTGTFANTTTAAPNSAGSTFRFMSNGLLWDINYAWNGNVPLSGVDSFTFEQTTGGSTVALLLVQVPEPGALVSLLGGGMLLLGWRRRRRAF